jgi:hypothetical protein
MSCNIIIIQFIAQINPIVYELAKASFGLKMINLHLCGVLRIVLRE